MQLVTEDNITDLAVERWATARDPRTGRADDRPGPASARLRPRGAAHRGRVDGRDPVADRTGQISDEKREEFILASDVLGLSMLVVQMNHRLDPRGHPGDGARALPHRGLAGVRVRRRHVRRRARHAALRPRHRARPGRQPGGRRRARRLAGRHRGRLRVAGARHRRGAAAGEVHDPRGRQLLRAHDRAEGLHDPDGRPGRRPHLARPPSATSARRTCTS